MLSQFLTFGRSIFLGLVFLAGVTCPANAEVLSVQATSKSFVVSLPPQAFFLRQLAPDADVQVMFRPGISHETFEPTIAQVRALSKAQVYFKIGHPAFSFEASWLQKFQQGNKALRLVDSSSMLNLRDDDVHVWLSTARMKQMVESMSSALVEIYPQEKTQTLQAKAVALENISALDKEIRTKLEPYRGRSFLVYHPAWGYFAEDFGLRQLAVETDGKEPGLARIEATLQAARIAGVKDIIVEPTSARETAAAISGQLGGQVYTVDPLAENWPENMRRMTSTLVEVFSHAKVTQVAPGVEK